MTDRRKQLSLEKNRQTIGSVALPKRWEQVVSACLAKDPLARPQSAYDVGVRLGLISETIPITTTTLRQRPGKQRTQLNKRWLIGALAIFILIGSGVAAWLFLQRNQVEKTTAVVARRPAIAKQPASQAAPAGANVSFAVEAHGVPEPTYQWRKNGLNIDGATTPTLTLRNVDQNDVGMYAVVVSNPSGTATTIPATLTLVQPAPASAPAMTPRQSWGIVATTPTHLTASQADGTVLFDGDMAAGAKQVLPVDKKLLLVTHDGRTLALEVDGRQNPLPANSSGRWNVTVPSAPDAQMSVQEAPPPPLPFAAELEPMVTRGAINQMEADWLRAALSGIKGEAEQALARALFAKGGALTLYQWRSRTALPFKFDATALTSTLPAQMAHAIDLDLPPGGATMRLIRIEPGTFRHGSPPEEVGHNPGDMAPAAVTIAKPYFIGIFEVTQRQFESVMGPRSNPSWWRGNPTWPVDMITWSMLEGRSGFFPTLNAQLATAFQGAVVADLPTEDEWEYACRAGRTTALNNGRDLTRYDLDPALNDIAQYGKDASGKPRPVGLLAPNAWGLYDMLGNVREWTAEHYVRGGSWQSRASACRSAARVQVSTEAPGSNTTGFRMILRLRPPAAE